MFVHRFASKLVWQTKKLCPWSSSENQECTFGTLVTVSLGALLRMKESALRVAERTNMLEMPLSSSNLDFSWDAVVDQKPQPSAHASLVSLAKTAPSPAQVEIAPRQ
jgi:hypothetical protein